MFDASETTLEWWQLSLASLLQSCSLSNESSVSVNLTANKENPTGTVAGHDELRQRCCDWIEKNRNSTVLQNIFKNRKKPFKTDAEIKEYVWKKRQTTGHFYTWSDGATSNATGGFCER